MMFRLLAAGILLSGFASAQEEGDQSHGVARVSLINGEVSVQHGDSGEWVAAAPNVPLVAQDHILTANGARAEVQFDSASFLRLNSDSEVRMADLESGRRQLQLAYGTVTLRVLGQSNAETELQTPNAAIRPLRPGSYRITVTQDGQSQVTVRAGEAEVSTPRGVERLPGGRTMFVRGDQQNAEFQVVPQVRADEWDRWNAERDRVVEHARAYQYVSPDIYGTADLDNYGRWVDVPEYGAVWNPTGVGPDWAPYRAGRWCWLDWYGWTWVSYDPWGWAPYHYGRWFYSSPYGWCWFPGPRHAHYFWRPGLVAFFGFGGGGVGFGFGSVGWVPLAPYEPFHAWWGRGWYGSHYGGSRVVVNNINIRNEYRNSRVMNGLTGIDAGGFARGGRGRMMPLNEVAGRASLVRGPVPVTPVGASQRFTDRSSRVAPRSQSARFYSPRPVAGTQRMSFEQQRSRMEQYVRRNPVVTGGAVRANNDSPGWRREQPSAAAGRMQPGVVPQAEHRGPAASGSEWQRFGNQPRPGPETRQPFAAPRSDPAGRWGQYQPAPSYSPRSNNNSFQPQRYPSQSIRINRPIVQERSQPRSAPQYSAPSRSAAPSHGGGGGHSISSGGGHGHSR